jgi:hypothetical protein
MASCGLGVKLNMSISNEQLSSSNGISKANNNSIFFLHCNSFVNLVEMT